MWNRVQPFYEGAYPECECTHRAASTIVNGLPLNAQYGAVHVLKNLTAADYAGMWHPEMGEWSETQYSAHEAAETPEEESQEHAGAW